MSVELERQEDNNWEQLKRNNDTVAKNLRPAMPNARVYNNANISTTTAANTALTFNSERWDSGNLHSTSANTERLTAPITGLYSIGGHAYFAANATGSRQISVRVNGSTYIAIQREAKGDATNVTVLSVETVYRLAAGEYVELVVQQTSGGNLDVTAAANYSPEFWMVRLGGYTNEGVA